jgi:hypothetical protein
MVVFAPHHPRLNNTKAGISSPSPVSHSTIAIVCLLPPGGQFELFCLVAGVENMTIKHSEVGCGLERPWEGKATIIFSGEN